MSRRSAIVLALAVTAGVLLGAQMASAVRTNGDASGLLGLQKLANFSSPDYVAQPPGSKQLVFVVEQGGTIAVARNGHKLGHKLLDITSRVEDRNESGLSSMAFDSGYRHNRRFYVFYARTDGNNEVDLFKRSRNSATRVAKGSRRRVILIPTRTRSTTGPSFSSGPTAISTSLRATVAVATTRSTTRTSSIRCSARSCASTRSRTAATRSLTGTLSSASPASTRSSPTDCATRGASRSTARPGESRSATWGRTRRRRSTTRRSGTPGRELRLA
jgi:Glucose / Sorbosone dehydrogenase